MTIRNNLERISQIAGRAYKHAAEDGNVSKTPRPLFHFLSPIKQKVANRWKQPAVFCPLSRRAWLDEPDVLTPACLSYSAEVVYSEFGTEGTHCPGGVFVPVGLCVRVCPCMCVLGCEGEGGGTVSSRECLVMGYQKQSTGGQWDLGHSWHNLNTLGRK